MLDVTEVRLELADERTANNDRIRAYASFVLGAGFLVRDVRVIEGRNGLLVAMPNRTTKDRCRDCGQKNALTAHYCNACGVALEPGRDQRMVDGGGRLWTDVAHPIAHAARETVNGAILEEYRRVLWRAPDES